MLKLRDAGLEPVKAKPFPVLQLNPQKGSLQKVSDRSLILLFWICPWRKGSFICVPRWAYRASNMPPLHVPRAPVQAPPALPIGPRQQKASA